MSGANLLMACCAPIESVIPAGITINGFTDKHPNEKSFIADSRDQEKSVNFNVDGHSHNHSLMDGYYASKIKYRQGLSS